MAHKHTTSNSCIYTARDTGSADDSKSESPVFEFRLNTDYEKWMKSKNKYEWQIKHEMGKILKINPRAIKVGNYRRGSVILLLQVQFLCYVNKWLRKIMGKLDPEELQKDFCGDVQIKDQVMVYRKDKWYHATIQSIAIDGNNKRFKVRYNPLDNANGKDPFVWNTEWFKIVNGKLQQDDRLMYNDKVYKDGIQTLRWKPRDVIGPGDKIKINDHLFVEFKGGNWSRGKVYKMQTHATNRTTIEVKDLVKGGKQKLDLWQPEDQRKIRFADPDSQYI